MCRRLLVVVFLTIFSISIIGCDYGENIAMINADGVSSLKIVRSVRYDPDPSLKILAKEIFFDYNNRTITVDGLINITGNSWGNLNLVVQEVSIKDSKLVIKIPSNNPYHIYIGKNHHYLPTIINN